MSVRDVEIAKRVRNAVADLNNALEDAQRAELSVVIKTTLLPSPSSPVLLTGDRLKDVNIVKYTTEVL
jgi:hypothetical protein